MSRKRQELYDKLCWSRLKTEDLSGVHTKLGTDDSESSSHLHGVSLAADEPRASPCSPTGSPPRAVSPPRPGIRATASNWLPPPPPPPPDLSLPRHLQGLVVLTPSELRSSRPTLRQRTQRPGTVDTAAAGGGRSSLSALDMLNVLARPPTAPTDALIVPSANPGRHSLSPLTQLSPSTAGAAPSMPWISSPSSRPSPDPCSAWPGPLHSARPGSNMGQHQSRHPERRSEPQTPQTPGYAWAQPTTPRTQPSQAMDMSLESDNSDSEQRMPPPAIKRPSTTPAAQSKVQEYVRMQRELIEEGLHRRRAAPGYRVLSTEPKVTGPITLKDALSAVYKGDIPQPPLDVPSYPLSDTSGYVDADGVLRKRQLDIRPGTFIGRLRSTAAAAQSAAARARNAGPSTAGQGPERVPSVAPTGLAAGAGGGGVSSAVPVSASTSVLELSRPGRPESSVGRDRQLSNASSSGNQIPRRLSRSRSRRRSIDSRGSRRRSSSGFVNPRPLEVDASQLFDDISIKREDDADDDLDSTLKQLKEGFVPQKLEEKVTYSHLVKSTLGTALSPFMVPRDEEWDPAVTLGWSNRGVSVKKMKLLRDMLVQNNFLTGLQLAGNSLNNDCVGQILSMLSMPGAPRITQLDLSSNASLDWRSAYPLARALGADTLPASAPVLRTTRSRSVSPDLRLQRGAPPMSTPLPPTGAAAIGGGALGTGGGPTGSEEPSTPGAADDDTDGRPRQGSLPDQGHLGQPILALSLRRLLLSGVKVGDRGALVIATALRNNKLLKELNLSRCSITDQGGTAIMQALAAGYLACLDLSWNSLRGETARALHETLATNGSLQQLILSHSSFGDMDAALVLMGLTQHGTWRHVDISYNNLAAGSAMVITELMSLLGKKAAEYIRAGKYGESWDPDASVAGKVDASSWAPQTESDVKSPEKPRFMRHEELGMQLAAGPLLLDIGGNPLGFAGLRHVLRSLDLMSAQVEEAAAAAAKPTKGDPDELPDWPIHLVLQSCNVDITDAPPEGAASEGLDLHSPNPFIPSLMMIAEGASGDKDGGAKKKKKKKKKGKPQAEDETAKHFFTSQSQSLQLSSPAGRYHLDMAHPGSSLLLRHLLGLASKSPAVKATPKDHTTQGVEITITDVTLNNRPSRVADLAKLRDSEKGMVQLTVQSPAILLTSPPRPLNDQVADWMLAALSDKNCNVLWKLSVIHVACSDFYFTTDQVLQLMELFDPEIALSERMRATEMMYARCLNPLDFWLQALPCLPPMQVEMLSYQLGEFAAFDIHNPAGRYMFNLSRNLDRFMAMRLQEASALENSSKHRCKYFICWRNAQLNGGTLSLEGLAKLRDFTIPDTGTLRVDYCCYEVPAPLSKPCSDDQIKGLITQLRAINNQYDAAVLKLREEYLPNAQLRSEIKANTPRGFKEVKPTLAGWNASQTLSRSFKVMLSELQLEASAKLAALRAPTLAPAAGTSSHAALAEDGGRAWWMVAGFDGGPAMLKRYADLLRSREEDANEAANAAAETAARVASSGKAGPRTRAGLGASSTDKGGRNGMGRGGKGGKSSGAASAVLPPHLRTAGNHLTEKELVQAEELAAQLLQAPRLKDVAQLLTKFSARHIARVLHVYMTADSATGAKVVAAILGCLAPTLAVRFVYDAFDQLQPLLPPEMRKQALAACSSKLLSNLGSLHAEVNTLALKRARQIRITLQCFVCNNRLSSTHLDRVLRALRHEQDRCAAMVILWSHVIDRPGLYTPFQTLNTEEQRQVMQRLGFWHVWNTIQSPTGLHFYLDLQEPEQKDIAKDVVKMACKATMAAKAQNSAQGLSQAVQHLLNLRGNGTLMTMPEDDKTWMSIESRYHSLEFDYAPTPEQVEVKRVRSAIIIQRFYLGHLRRHGHLKSKSSNSVSAMRDHSSLKHQRSRLANSSSSGAHPINP